MTEIGNLLCLAGVLARVFRWRCLLGLAMLLAAPQAIPSDGSFVLRFCTPGVAVANIDVARDCTLPTRPELPDNYGYTEQLVLLTVNNASAKDEVTSLWITPYYLNKLVIFSEADGSWQPIVEGGAVFGPSLVSAHLGGHRFNVPVAPGKNEFLLEVYAPHFAHLSIRLDEPGQTTNQHEVLLSMHLGMLILLFVLVVSAWVIRPAALEARLAFLTGCVLLSVVIGSGAIYRIWPSASVHWVGFFMFNASVALRIGAIAWVYASLIGPYNNRPSYKTLNALTYSVTAVAVFLFATDLPSYGWPLVALLLILALFAPAWGLWTAKPMPRLLSGAIMGSVVFYLGLNLFAFYSLMNTSGQNDWPVYAVRVVDLALPLVLFAVVILRNRVADRELEQAKAEIANKVTQLNAERRVTQEKRMLLDMLTHEIKNPLASIRFAIRNLSQTRQGNVDIQARKLQTIQSSVRSIDEVIDRCNLANGLEDESIEPQRESVDVGVLVKDLVQASEQCNRIVLSLAPTRPIQSDPYLLKIILANLLDNATKYAVRGSTVHVAVTTEASGLVSVRVTNEIEPSSVPDIDRLFERYYRHESAQHIRGSGLGLPLSRSVCGLIGAKLTCRVQANQIEFEVTFENA
ncbi:MAG: HAMP domain-containing histidine kinase [Burkholderiaceae bacterium]|nr:HAMP domain-containing histidine kinase [Burkholderiaceae bacterium]